MSFTWDEDKAEWNIIKHNIAFDEAQTVFDDSLFVVFRDLDHSLR